MTNYLKVPQGVEYLSNWAGFELPKGIFNKGVTGCGATTVAIEDGHKTVICCPRINLIKNKSRDGVMAVYGDVRTDAIKAYIEGTEIPKILVTYDGFPRVAKLIEDRTDWRVVVDEYQYLLIDSGFKSEIEGKLLDTLKGFPYVTYLSATPIADKYMMEIDHFKSVPVTVLEWNDVERTVVKRVESNSPIDNALMIVRNYQAGNFTRIGDVESKECVIFLNSVENIVNIVKKTGLSPDDVNIIVGSSDDNKTLIKKLGEGFEVGAIPKEGEKHKMFTFCTSTAFAGCDFYSTCASTFVISDNRRQHTSIDIATELTQIAGRQRLAINPFRKTICFIYNTDIGTNDGYRVRLDEKLATSDRMAYFKNSISDEAVRRAEIKSIITLQRVERYKESYVMYNADSDRFDVNHWAYLNECFAYDVQHENYLNEYVVRAQLENSGLAVDTEVQKSDYEEQLSCIITKEGFAEKMKRYCEYRHYDTWT